MKPPPVRLIASRQLSSSFACQTRTLRAHRLLLTSVTRRNASYSAPAANYGGNAESLRRRHQPKPASVLDKITSERAQRLKRMRYSAYGLIFCAVAMYGAIRAYNVTPHDSENVDSTGAVKTSRLTTVTQNESPNTIPEAPASVLEQAELVPTGTSTIPFFPRTIHLSDRTATANPQTPPPTPALPTGTSAPPPPPIITTVATTSETSSADGIEYQLLGLGVRTVSIFSIQVYVVGLYVASSDIAKLQERLIRTIDPVATTLVPGEKQKLRDVLLDPVRSEEVWNAILKDGGIRTAFRIVPTRNTDFMHMRDGFVRGITARANTAGAGAGVGGALGPQPHTSAPVATEGFGEAMNTFKALFSGGSRKKIPWGHTLYLLRNAEGVFQAVYEDNGKTGNAVRELLGTVHEEGVSRLLWLNYLAGKNVSSEELRSGKNGVVEGAVGWCGRPVGTVATQVV